DYDKGILSAFQVIHARENTLSWIDLGDVLPPWNVSEDRFARQCEDWEFEEEPQSWPDPSPGWLDPADEWSFARLQRTYAAMVETLDEKIGQWLEWFSQQPWWPETVLIFTAGRGQNLGEHGLIGDFRPWLHEELIHLPLMIRLPHDEQAGRRVFALTQTVDIPATILDCFGIAKPEEWHGSSLLPLCRGGAPVRSFACTGLRIGEATEFALRMPDAGIIVPYKVPPEDPPRNPMLFIKPDDRWEVNDLRQANLDEAENLEQTLRNYIAASGLAGEIASDVSERSPSCQP
ncbi:MAG TPA: sulfatase-like hydrolase/transferase, partial [Gemmataceae bacterium]|nr:sulfatase-like hydrolase/transferase [Gemmataceae bacterium]